MGPFHHVTQEIWRYVSPSPVFFPLCYTFPFPEALNCVITCTSFRKGTDKRHLWCSLAAKCSAWRNRQERRSVNPPARSTETPSSSRSCLAPTLKLTPPLFFEIRKRHGEGRHDNFGWLFYIQNKDLVVFPLTQKIEHKQECSKVENIFCVKMGGGR